MAVSEISGWVWPENVRTTVQYLSLFVGYAFDDTDWQAIQHGLRDTTCEPPERWYDYPIVGTPTLTVFLALDPGADPVFVRVLGEMDKILRARIDTLLSVLADVRPTSRPVASKPSRPRTAPQLPRPGVKHQLRPDPLRII